MVQANTPIHIRKATLADLAIKKHIQAVVNNAYQGRGGWTTETHVVEGERSSLEYIEASIKDQHNPLLLAIEEDKADDQVKVVGAVQIQPVGPDEAGIGMLSVSPKHQSKGIGSGLIRNAIDEIKSLGFKAAVITVLERRPELLTWYKKIGFEETGERKPFPYAEKLKVPDVGLLVLKKTLV